MKYTMKAIPLALAAGTLALAVTGCGTIDRMHDRASADRSSTVTTRTERTVTTDRAVVVDRAGNYDSTMARSNTPAVVDPFSPGYASFPATSNESAGPMGHSFYCVQHYSQPGCQTADGLPQRGYRARDDRRSSLD